MNALEKYAAKKKLTKSMIERLSTALYGEKPVRGHGRHLTGLGLGALGGNLMSGGQVMPTVIGGMAGKSIGSSMDALAFRKELAAYKRNKILTNILGGTAAGTAAIGSGGLASLLANKKG